MPEFVTFIWDYSEGGNVEHLDEHGVTPNEVEDVIRRYFDDREPSRSTPEYWTVFGDTSAGRYPIVVFELLDEGSVINPVTAYDPQEL